MPERIHALLNPSKSLTRRRKVCVIPFSHATGRLSSSVYLHLVPASVHTHFISFSFLTGPYNGALTNAGTPTKQLTATQASPRLIVQILVSGAQIFGKALSEAGKQAVKSTFPPSPVAMFLLTNVSLLLDAKHNPQSALGGDVAGVGHATSGSPTDALTRTHRMTLDEAHLILNLKRGEEMERMLTVRVFPFTSPMFEAVVESALKSAHRTTNTSSNKTPRHHLPQSPQPQQHAAPKPKQPPPTHTTSTPRSSAPGNESRQRRPSPRGTLQVLLLPKQAQRRVQWQRQRRRLQGQGRVRLGERDRRWGRRSHHHHRLGRVLLLRHRFSWVDPW